MELQPLRLRPLFWFMALDWQSIQNWHLLKQ